MAFLIGDDPGAVRVEANSVGGAESTRDDLGGRAIRADAEERAVVGDDGLPCMAGRLGVVEGPFRIGLQAHRKFVEVFGDLVIVVEGFHVIDFLVAIQVVEAGELVPAGDVDGVIDNF